MTTKAKALLAAFLFTAAAPVPALAAAAQEQSAAKPKLTVSKEASAAIVALQKASKENRMADIPGLAQAALAVAKTPVDRYFVYQLQLQPALAAKNDAMLLTALEGMIASGVPQGTELTNITFNAAKLNFNANNLDKAASQIEKVVALDPNNPDHHIIMGAIRSKQKRPAEAVAALQKAAALQQQQGKPFDKTLAEQTFAIAYNNRLPAARDIALAQVKAAPSPQSWRRALKVYADTSNLPATDKVDLFRLQRMTNSLEGEGDYYPYVDALLTRGLPGEAKAVLDEAFAANKLERTKPTWKEMAASAGTRVAADRAGLAAGERAALAGASARPALNTGDAYLGYGDYAKAAALYRAALGKSGVDADLANLRLGIALTGAGDKAGATAAFNKVKGSRAGLAQLWLLHLSTKA